MMDISNIQKRSEGWYISDFQLLKGWVLLGVVQQQYGNACLFAACGTAWVRSYYAIGL